MAHKLLPLRFGYDALEPYIDAETMELHHDKHHKAYVDNLNKALEPYPQLAELAVEDLLHRLDQVPETIRTAVRNNGGATSTISSSGTFRQIAQNDYVTVIGFIRRPSRRVIATSIQRASPWVPTTPSRAP